MLAAQQPVSTLQNFPSHTNVSIHQKPLPSHKLESRAHSQSLPASISITAVDPATLPAYRRLITSLLPIRYPDKFYQESVSDPSQSLSIALCATHIESSLQNGKRKRDNTVQAAYPGGAPVVVAGIQARLEPVPPLSPSSPPDTNDVQSQKLEYQIYVQTLATTAPYRCLSLATHLLHNLILAFLTNHPDKSITSIYAHVWEANNEALAWYRNRGFLAADMVESYYRKLRPGGARVLRKNIGVGEYLEAKKLEQIGDTRLRMNAETSAVKEDGQATDGQEPHKGIDEASIATTKPPISKTPTHKAQDTAAKDNAVSRDSARAECPE